MRWPWVERRTAESYLYAAAGIASDKVKLAKKLARVIKVAEELESESPHLVNSRHVAKMIREAVEGGG